MNFKAEILADHRSRSGARLTTFKLTYPRFVHSEHLRHRTQSFSVESSRAMPLNVKLSQVISHPVVPLNFGGKQTGMVAAAEHGGWKTALARQVWLKTRYGAVAGAWLIDKLGVHKSIPNRIIEPWSWVTVICTATEWENFWNLRIASDAQDEIRRIAEMAKALYDQATPKHLEKGEWAIPLVSDEELGFARAGIFSWEYLAYVSAGRIARESYAKSHLTEDPDVSYARAEKLRDGAHWSPFEHQAVAIRNARTQSGNLIGFSQFRKHFFGEAVKSPSPVV